MAPRILRLDGVWYCQFGEVVNPAALRTGDLPSWTRAPVPMDLRAVFAPPVDWRGDVCCARVFMRPDMTRDQALVLVLTGVCPQGDVYCNGRRVGGTGFTSALDTFDLTPFLRDGDNLLLVRVRARGEPDVPVPAADPPLGIWAPLWLEIRPRIHLVSLQAGGRADGSWTARLRWSAASDAPCPLRVRILEPGGRIASQWEGLWEGQEVMSIAGQPLKRVLAWDPQYPSLYRMDVSRDGPQPERRTAVFAFRSIHADGEGFRLNGRRFFLRGVRDDLRFEGWGRTAPSARALVRRLRAARELGFNTMVTADMPPDSRLPRLADRVGMLLWYEVPCVARLDGRGGRNLRRVLDDALERDVNSPSLCLVSLFPRDPPPEGAEAFVAGEGVCGGDASPIVVPGPARGLAGRGPLAFIAPREPGAPSCEGRARLVWTIDAVACPDLREAVGEKLQALGDSAQVIRDIVAAQNLQRAEGIARARGELLAHGYVAGRLCDGPDDRSGMLLSDGSRKAAVEACVQGDDWAGVWRGPRACVAGERVALNVAVSHFSGRDLRGAAVRCRLGDSVDVLPVDVDEAYTAAGVAHVIAPHGAGPRVEEVEIALESCDGRRWASSVYPLHVLPAFTPRAQEIHLGGALAADEAFAAALARRGYRLAPAPSREAPGIWRGLSYERMADFARGMRGIFLIEDAADVPSGAGLAAEGPDPSRQAFLWLRADSPVFTGITRRWIAGPTFGALADGFSFTGVDARSLCDVLAALIPARCGVPRPVVMGFSLGRGVGLLCGLPLRKSCLAGDVLGTRVLDAMIAALEPGGLPRPRFTPDISPVQVLVPPSRQGSCLWRFAYDAPRAGWFRPEFDDRGWRRSRGAFGRRGTHDSVIRRTWETPEIFLRADFVVARVPRLLRLQILHDRDVEVAINGRFVLCREGYTSSLATVDLAVDPREILVEGRNLIAVHCCQHRASHNLDVGLVAVY